LGDARLTGLEDTFAIDAAPPLPVRVSPFFMDRFEVSVGEVRALFAAGVVTTTPPLTRDAGNPDQEHCNWLGVDDGGRDDHPVNCVVVDTAEAVCAARGGRLPSEAEWEHAARGRGRGDARPWGNADPICCATQAAHIYCSRPPGTAPVDAYAEPASCPLADVSRDGVVGLAGNVGELTADAADDYDGSCWQYEGVPLDPRCEASEPIRAARGGSWNNSLALTHGAFRLRYVPSGNGGFRCVYDDASEGDR
jgi:formylglycine-generating enzyme required for sulfatase activity